MLEADNWDGGFAAACVVVEPEAGADEVASLSDLVLSLDVGPLVADSEPAAALEVPAAEAAAAEPSPPPPPLLPAAPDPEPPGSTGAAALSARPCGR